MQTPLPSGEIWNLFPSLAVIVLVMAVVFGGLFVIWREYRTWMEKQDKKRAEERKEQRLWEEQQDALRDERWRNFIGDMQEAASREDEKNRGQMADMATSINTLADNSRKMAETVDGLIKTVMGLSDTLTGHIAVDDARFEVLLSDYQKEAVIAVQKKGKK